MAKAKQWQVLELLNTTSKFLEQKGIENPRLNTEQLLGKVLNLSRVELYVSFERPLSPSELNDFRQLVKRRANREPLQYILGETEFMGLPFEVSPAVLIPRPETEVLVEEVLKLKPEFETKKPIIADVGTGSGCIPISLAHFWKEARCVGLDISDLALEVAKRNAQINKTEAQLDFHTYDIFKEWNSGLPQDVHILVSNPPYIAEGELDGLQAEVVDFEPRIALTDEGDGLRFYRRLFELCADPSAPHCTYLFLEMSGSQPQKIIDLARNYNFGKTEQINDLNGIPRVLKVKVKNG